MTKTAFGLLALVFLLVSFSPAPAKADVGYLPPQYAGKCDPYPNNQIIPDNDAYKACYIARYGVEPGANAVRIGYCCELFGVNETMLHNMCVAGNFGPGHDCNPTFTEMLDASFTIGRGSPQACKFWWAAVAQGGTPEDPQITKTCDREDGETWSAPHPLHRCTTYYKNERPASCNVTPPPPPPPVEPTCPSVTQSCLDKLCPTTTCPTCPPVPTVDPVPPRAIRAVRVALARSILTSTKEGLQYVLDLLSGMEGYVPGELSTGKLETVVKEKE